MSELKRTAYIAVFGALWGILEMTMGGVLHALRIPFKGMIMAGMGAFIVCSAQRWAGGKWTGAALGVIAAFLKLFSLGGLVLSPAIAILLEGAIGSVILMTMGKSLTGCIIAGAAMTVYSVGHKLFSLAVIYRTEAMELYNTFSKAGGFLAGISGGSLVLLLILYASLHIIAGGIMGTAAYFSTIRAGKRLKGTGNAG